MLISSYNINVNIPNARPTQSQMMSLIENSVFLKYLSYTSFRTKITTVIMIASHSGVYFDSHITKFWQTIMCAMPSIPILERSLLANALILFIIFMYFLFFYNFFHIFLINFKHLLAKHAQSPDKIDVNPFWLQYIPNYRTPLYEAYQ